MALVKPGVPRSRWVETPDGLEVVIPARPVWPLAIWFAVVVVGVIVGLGFALADMPRSGSPGGDPAPMMLVAVMAIPLLFIAFMEAWMLAGRERVRLGSRTLLIRPELFGVGRQWEYELDHVRNLRVSPFGYLRHDPTSGLRFFGASAGTIAFDYGAATVRFGAALQEGEAAAVVERLKQRYPGLVAGA